MVHPILGVIPLVGLKAQRALSLGQRPRFKKSMSSYALKGQKLLAQGSALGNPQSPTHGRV